MTKLEAFDAAIAALPKSAHEEAPWSLAGSGVSVNLPKSLGKIRQEGVGSRRDPALKARAEGNARIMTAAPTLYNLAWAALEALNTDAPQVVRDQTAASLIEALAWIHKDPDKGAKLRAALDLADDLVREADRALYR